jgi:hypothetical protein
LDLIDSKNVLHFFRHAVTRALDLANPPPVNRTHSENTVMQLDRRSSRQSLTNGELPREIRPLFRRRLTPNDFRKHA